MKKELKDYIHLYPNCECKVKIWDKGDTREADVTFYRIKDEMPTVLIEGMHGNYGDDEYNLGSWAYIKPLLRPLTDMKYEDMKIWADYCGEEISSEDMKELLLDFQKNGIGSFDAPSPSQKDVALHYFNLTRILLDRRFDLYGLIEDGLALDKTKIN